MILKVMVLPADSEGIDLISVALLQINGRFKSDTTFDVDDAEKACRPGGATATRIAL